MRTQNQLFTHPLLALVMRKSITAVQIWRKVSYQVMHVSCNSHVLLCIPWKHRKLQRRATIDCCILSSSVASLWPTLSELVRDRESVKAVIQYGPAHQLAVPRMLLPSTHVYFALRVCTLLLFIIVVTTTTVYYKSKIYDLGGKNLNNTYHVVLMMDIMHL